MTWMRALLFVWATWAATAAVANVPRPMPVEDQIRHADAVIVGRVVQVTRCRVGHVYRRCVEMNDISYVSKTGDIEPSPNITVVLDRGIDELRVTCCRVGERYLMILVKFGDDFALVHGSWSVFRIEAVGAAAETS